MLTVLAGESLPAGALAFCLGNVLLLISIHASIEKQPNGTGRPQALADNKGDEMMEREIYCPCHVLCFRDTKLPDRFDISETKLKCATMETKCH